MDLTTFNNHLDRLGHKLEAWPEALAADAQVLLAASAEARSALEQAATISEALAALPDQPAPAQLRDRILAATRAEAAPGISTGPGSPAATSEPQTAEGSRQRFLDGITDWFTGALWRPALAATATVAFGFALGLSLPAATPDDEQFAAELGFLALSAGYEELGDEE